MPAEADSRWYVQEAERIISEADENLLVEILKVRDAACALYATATVQLTDKFPDKDVVAFLDNIVLDFEDRKRVR
jgi:DICT domain-containing protein